MAGIIRTGHLSAKDEFEEALQRVEALRRRFQNVIRHAGTAAEKGVARIVSTLVLGQLVDFLHCVTDAEWSSGGDHEAMQSA